MRPRESSPAPGGWSSFRASSAVGKWRRPARRTWTSGWRSRSANVVECFEIRGDDGRGQRDVPQLLADTLTSIEAVPNDVLQRRGSFGLLVLLVEQQPGIGHDGIRVF